MATRSSTIPSLRLCEYEREARARGRALGLALVCLVLIPTPGGAWPDPACDLADYEDVIGDPDPLPLPAYLKRLALPGVEEGVEVIRISGDPGTFVGPVAPGKLWPEVLTHNYSLVHPCNADDSMCLLDVDKDCVDLGPSGFPSFECVDTPLGPLVIDSDTLRPIYELSDPSNEDWRWDPTDPSRLIYVNESGEVGYLDVPTESKSPVRDFGLDYSALELGGGSSKSNPARAGDQLALFGRRNADAQSVCFSYNLVTDVKGPDIVTEEATWCGMSGKGEILTVYFRSGSSRPGQLDAYDLNGTLLATFPENQHPSHWAFTILDPFGAAVEAAVGRQKVSGRDPQILRSLTSATISQLDVGFSWSHTSTTNEPSYNGWSITSDSDFDGRMGLVSHLADPSGNGITKFIAYPRSDGRQGEGKLENHSEPTCANFGRRRIICSSNWHSQVAKGEGVGSFVWDLSAPGGPCRSLPEEVWPRPFPECDDGEDNDGDGFVDLADPACHDGHWDTEVQPCQDGLDNDGDGLVDFDGGVSIYGLGSAQVTEQDPHCVGVAWQTSESPPRRSCGLGFGLSVGMLLLFHLRRARWAGAARIPQGLPRLAKRRPARRTLNR
jgi:hypothetical protein